MITTPFYDSAPIHAKAAIESFARQFADMVQESTGATDADIEAGMPHMREGMAVFLKTTFTHQLIRSGRQASELAALAIQQAMRT